MKKNINKAYNIESYDERHNSQLLISEKIYKLLPKIIEYVEKIDEKETKAIKA